MRKITEEAANALFAGGKYSNSNTKVKDGVLSLHSNAIAFRYADEVGNVYLKIQDCGWRTVTTKERLNGVLDAYNMRQYLFQRNHEWFMHLRDDNIDVRWKGTATFIVEVGKA